MTTILGLDLGKFKSVACFYNPDTQEARYSTIPTDPDTLSGFLAAARPDLTVFETCTVAG
jgi:transposase